ncbi:methyltransferase domain-containing protein [Runella aurantiaca]|uniref:Methyltransferase domain-containing protein n=1 Tax=Runella aurantiaca TaxID=2282308 RepID=A0A369I5K8_9BACT|nr:methyltransferase domain-containing protein [Runella aurantiaca]RDB04332.1 methyltransferase domain-containing protein [Runella aurantiaca]
MKQFLSGILDKLGFMVVTKRKIKTYQLAKLEQEYPMLEDKGIFIKARANGGLKEKLVAQGKTRWLEIGCGGTFDDYFVYIDLFPETLVNQKGKYYRLDMVNATDESLQKLGKFDLIRMQHVFEHFTPEAGRTVLENCAKLLNKDGYILISTPDLRKYIGFYLSGQIRNNFDWALNRIPKDSPNSFYFSVFSHSLPFEKHEWCYDAEGLLYQMETVGKFKNAREITLEDEMANIPFTHNRPNEDVCVLAQLK